MSFIIDTDTCSAYLKDDRRIFPRFMQHIGTVHMSAVTMMELLTWRARAATSDRRKLAIDNLFRLAPVINVDELVAIRCGTLRGKLLDQGIVVAVADLLIAATALVYDYTLVTHNVRHFGLIPDLRVQDWIQK